MQKESFMGLAPAMDFINPLHFTPSSYALRQNFTPKKASQKFGVERKMALWPTFSLYEINPKKNKFTPTPTPKLSFIGYFILLLPLLTKLFCQRFSSKKN